MSRADDHFDADEWMRSHSRRFYKIMNVEFNTGGTNFIPVQQAPARPTQSAPARSDTSDTFSPSSVQDTLSQSAQARPEKVAQATALLSDGTYPSDAALNQLAGFLANRL